MGRAPRKPPSAEPRWPVMLAIAVVFLLLGLLPERIRLLPAVVPYLVGAAGILPMAAVSLAADKAPWLRVERAASLAFFALMAVGTLLGLGQLVVLVIRHAPGIGGLQLLTSGVGVWVNNVLMFSLLFWQVDRGGPGARAAAASPRPDWLFPQEGAPRADLPAGWRPTFVDYLFLAFSTATAFSATDVAPLTPRAKLMMMLESMISLVTIVVVAARAINVLGA